MFCLRKKSTQEVTMAVAAAQKNREMFAIKKSYSIEVSFFPKDSKFIDFLITKERDEKSVCVIGEVYWDTELNTIFKAFFT